MCIKNDQEGTWSVIRRYWALKVSPGTKFRVIGRYWGPGVEGSQVLDMCLDHKIQGLGALFAVIGR